MTRLLCVLAAALAGLGVEARAQPVEIPEVPALSVTLSPADVATRGGTVQGQIVLRVQVASRHPFEELDLDLPDIAGAEVIRLTRPRTRKVRSYAGDGYVHELHLALFPEASGVLDIPPVRVAGRVAPAPDRELRFEDESRAWRIPIAGIDPNFDAPWWLVSDRVQLTETWSKPLAELRFGDVVRREVTAVAFGVTANRMPKIQHGRTQRVTVTDAGTSEKTEFTKDGVVATVTRAWDLKVAGEVVVYFSPIGVDYWHPGERVPRKAALPGHRVEPLPADSAAIAERLMARAAAAHAGSRTLALGLLAVLLAPLVLLAGAALWLALPSRADRQLIRRCAAAATPVETYRAILAWRDASGLWPAEADGAAGASARSGPVAAIEAQVFAGRAAGISGREVAADLVRLARRRRLRRLYMVLVRWFRAIAGERIGLGAHPAQRPG